MNELLDRLLENLVQEKEIYKGLLEISERKKQVIVDNNIKELEKIVQMERRFIIDISRLEDERLEIIDAIAAEKKVPSENITISTLISWAPEGMARRLEAIRQELKDIIEKQKDLNRLNEKLLKINLEYVNFAVNFLVGSSSSSSVYEEKGQATKMKQSRNLFDKKV